MKGKGIIILQLVAILLCISGLTVNFLAWRDGDVWLKEKGITITMVGIALGLLCCFETNIL